MKPFLIAAAFVLPGGSVLLLLEWLYRRHQRTHQPDLVPRWKAFIDAPAAEGEPTIAPAKVPSVKRLTAEKVDRFRRFRQRLG